MGKGSVVVPNTATVELNYYVSHISTNTATGFELLYSKKNIGYNSVRVRVGNPGLPSKDSYIR